MKTVDFMIVGAQKAGTTALSHFLSQHPHINVAACKEVHLFDAQDYSPDWSQDQVNTRYEPHFLDKPEAQIYGEATPIYIYWPEIAAQLQRYNPDLKLIIMLRDPVARALSHYAMEKGRGNERLPFWLALLLEPLRLGLFNKRLPASSARCHSYVDRGFYAKQIDNMRRYFSDSQLLIVENTELMLNHHKTLQRIYRFLGVDASNLTEQEQVFAGDYNKSLHPVYDIFLRWRFKNANQLLKSQLIAMGYSPEWSWLG